MFEIFSLDAPISEKADSQEAAIALADQLAQENPGARIDVFQEPNLHVYHVVWDGEFERKNFMQYQAGFEDDESVAAELAMWAGNTASIYQQLRSIQRNLTRKMAQGTYDSNLAIKAFMYLAESAAKDYAREFGGIWHQMFPKNIRLMAAKQLRDEFEADIEAVPENFEEFVYKKDLPAWQEKYRGRESRKQCGCPPATQPKRGEIMTRSKNRRQRLANRVREARKNAEQKRRLAREDARENDQEEKLQRKAQSLRKMLRKAERELLQLRREQQPDRRAAAREERSADVRERIARIRAEREAEQERKERIAAARERIRRKQQIREKIAARKAEREKQASKEQPEKREAEAPKYFRRKKDGQIYVRVD